MSLCLCPGGLEDLVLSALVQEQLEGITPQALTLMAPKKMAVSCHCSCLCYLIISSAFGICAVSKEMETHALMTGFH